MIDTKSILGLGPGLQPGLGGAVPPATQQQTTAAESCLSLLRAACWRLVWTWTYSYQTQTYIHIHLDKLSIFRRLRTVFLKELSEKQKLPIVKALKRINFKKVNGLSPRLVLFFCPFTLYFPIFLKIWSKLSPENEATLNIIVMVFILKLFPILYEPEKIDSFIFSTLQTSLLYLKVIKGIQIIIEIATE